MNDTSIFSEAVLTWNRLEELSNVLGESNVFEDLIRFLPLDKVKEFIDSEIQIHELYAVQD
jgi:hypothetical protein